MSCAKIYPFILASFLFGQFSFASTLPDNSLHLEDNILSKESNLTEADFNAIIDRALTHYAPIAKHHKAEFIVDRLWEDPTVNAMTGRLSKLWFLFFYGGLARRPEITKDGFQLVVCHELGHLLAGYPYKKTILGRLSWSSLEGEADYFATHSCLRDLWAKDFEENKTHAASVDTYAKSICNSAWSKTEERELCYRISNASQSVANLFARNSKTQPKFDTPDYSRVSKTFKKHPVAQCRLDTYLSGASCVTEFNPKKIPGQKYVPWLSSQKKAEKEAALVSCHQAQGEDLGVRPECWFRPRLDI